MKSVSTPSTPEVPRLAMVIHSWSVLDAGNQIGDQHRIQAMHLRWPVGKKEIAVSGDWWDMYGQQKLKINEPMKCTRRPSFSGISNSSKSEIAKN